MLQSSSAHTPSLNTFLCKTCRERQEHLGVHLQGLVPQTDAPALCHCHPGMITGCGRWFPSAGMRQEFIPALSSLLERQHLHTAEGPGQWELSCPSGETLGTSPSFGFSARVQECRKRSRKGRAGRREVDFNYSHYYYHSFSFRFSHFCRNKLS